jgi:tetratricopeptide (TPR) repeat protein
MNERAQFPTAPARSQPAAPDAFAQAAALIQAQRPLRNRRLQEISADLRKGAVENAEKALRVFLARTPDYPDAIMLMAQAVWRRGQLTEALKLLARALELAPDFAAARLSYAKLLLRINRYCAALAETETLLSHDGENPVFRQLKAMILAAIGEDEQALAIFRQLTEENPARAECWIKYGDALRAMGVQEACIAAYRRAIESRPWFGSAWWSLANLKTFRFTEADIDLMRKQLERRGISDEDRINIVFSLGKAYEDQGAYDRSFEQYAIGNAARRLGIQDDRDFLTSRVPEKKAVFSSGFFRSRSGIGCKAKDPIFIVGRPRSGSTLVEQILSSHSAIEGTAELPYLTDFAVRLLEQECRAYATEYPQIYEKLDPAVLTAFGAEYMESTRVHRKTDRPFFIDKAPANYHHVGMIHLILPNAKIIDARRHPVACCLSMFKHNYIETNRRLAELGQIYRDYVVLMAHYDRVLPGRVHRVIYENMVANPEEEIRKIFDYLELPFEEKCLRFHETERTVRTPSSEQVRRPISGEAVDHWRKFEPWLAPLINSLGSVLTEYPEVPDDLR